MKKTYIIFWLLLSNINLFAQHVRSEDLRPTTFTRLIDTIVIVFIVVFIGGWLFARFIKIVFHIKHTVKERTPIARNLDILKRWYAYKRIEENHISTMAEIEAWEQMDFLESRGHIKFLDEGDIFYLKDYNFMSDYARISFGDDYYYIKYSDLD